LDQIKAGASPYHFIEVMTCPGGCLGGGGQPIPTTWAIRQKRAESIYREDVNLGIRKSHENPEIQALYRDFLSEPLGTRSHHLLHTAYTARGII
jgi:iron only hydrogenase large subunit-like protein